MRIAEKLLKTLHYHINIYVFTENTSEEKQFKEIIVVIKIENK